MSASDSAPGADAAQVSRSRTEHVGSLLRPPELLAARAAREAGDLDAAALRAVEDGAIREALELQRAAGVEMFTDGEFRRGSWKALFWEGMRGVRPAPEPVVPRSSWRDVPTGVSEAELRLESVAVAERLSADNGVLAAEASFLVAHAPSPVKVTVPSPTMAEDLFRRGVSDAAYATADEMLADVIALQAEQIAQCVALGVAHIQLDSVRYTKHITPGKADREAVARLVDLDNALLRAVRGEHPHVMLGVHVCRGNNRSAWMASGGYDLVAEQLFGGVEADRFLLEFDDERSGDFAPLRHMPAGRTVVLGLVSTKTPVLEDPDVLLRRIDEAARHVDGDRLALSPQCGFASTFKGNLLTIDDERRKLELVANTAVRAWG